MNSSSNASPSAALHGANLDAEPAAVHAPDCQSHIMDVRGRPDECTCGAVRSIAGRATRLAALADAYEPGEYALCDGVYHVYAGVPECCQTLRDDIRWALELALSQGEEFLEFKEALSDLRQLRSEHRALNGGGPGFNARYEACWARIDELFANEDEAAYDRQQEDAHG